MTVEERVSVETFLNGWEMARRWAILLKTRQHRHPLLQCRLGLSWTRRQWREREHNGDEHDGMQKWAENALVVQKRRQPAQVDREQKEVNTSPIRGHPRVNTFQK